MTIQNINQFLTPAYLADSVLCKNLNEEFVLSENGNLVFHWADFSETCEVIKSRLENDPMLIKDFKGKAQVLTQLAGVPVWLRTEKKVYQSTMHELYEKYILNQMDTIGEIDPFSPLEISFISATGPFKGMSIVECFNETTYRDFVMLYLIEGKLPKRNYRLRLKSKILIEYGDEFSNAELVSLDQLTTDGLLLSMDSETYMKKVSGGENIRLLLNTKILEDGVGKGLNDLKAHLSQYAFNLLYSSHRHDSIEIKMTDVWMQSSFDFSKSKRIFLFTHYDKLNESHPQGVKAIRDFVEHTKGLVRNHYQKMNQKTKSA